MDDEFGTMEGYMKIGRMLGIMSLFLSSCGESFMEKEVPSTLNEAMSNHWLYQDVSSGAFNAFKKMAENGDPVAERYYAYYLREGRWVEKDEKKAGEIFERVFPVIEARAKHGDALAQFVTGEMLTSGEGVAADPVAGHRWCVKSAEQGFAPAQNIVADMLQHGSGIDRDPVKALEWRIKAAEQRFPPSEFFLGSYYFKEGGKKENLKKAFDWYRRSAKHGFPEAQNELAKMYGSGSGCRQDYRKAYKWYLKAAEHGVPEAHYALAEMQHLGNGIERNTEKALAWLSGMDMKGVPELREKVSALRDEIEARSFDPKILTKRGVFPKMVLDAGFFSSPVVGPYSISSVRNGVVIIERGLGKSSQGFDLDTGALHHVQSDSPANFMIPEGASPGSGLPNGTGNFILYGFPGSVSNSGRPDDFPLKKFICDKTLPACEATDLAGTPQWLDDRHILLTELLSGAVRLSSYDTLEKVLVEKARFEIPDFNSYETVGVALTILPEYDDGILVIHKSFVYENYDGWGNRSRGRNDVFVLYRLNLKTNSLEMISEVSDISVGSPPIPAVAMSRRPGYNQILLSLHFSRVLLVNLENMLAHRLVLHVKSPSTFGQVRGGIRAGRYPVFDLPAGKSYHWSEDGKSLVFEDNGIFVAEVR